MAKLLNVLCELKPVEKSPALCVASEFLKEYSKCFPGDEIHTLDLYRDHIQRIDADVLSGWEKIELGHAFATLADDEQRKIGRIWKLADQFIDADKYVFVTPVWDVGFPAEFKSYIDAVYSICRASRYTHEGPKGAFNNKNKKCLHFYGSNKFRKKNQVYDEVSYFSYIMSYLGVADVETIVVSESDSDSNDSKKAYSSTVKKAIEAASRF